MIVATAGHVDHGKTLLVKALTGVDTDRLPEEKRRGLTIDLGFAYEPLADGRVLGFVDVPGHERFIRNMLAGVAAIDFALLVVAVDDGPKPQTIEHLAILDLLGIQRGAVALSKIDRVDPARIEEVGGQVRELLAPTSLAGAPMFALSAPTGEGVEALHEHLRGQAAALAAREAGGNFRLAVDRSFTVAGAGLVVTGAVFSGSARVGDRLVISPQGLAVRVRGLHVHDRKADEVSAGARCALNLAGADLKRESVSRGDWVLAQRAHAPSDRVDARLRVLASETRPLRHWTPAHLHVGAASVTCRVAVLEGRAIAPGESAFVQLVLDRPIGALRGDRLVLRDQSARRTMAGGEVLDPFGPARGRARPERLKALAAWQRDDAAQALTALLGQAERGVNLDRFEQAWNLDTEEAARLSARVELVAAGVAGARVAFAPEHWRALGDRIVAALGAWHERVPGHLGPDQGQVRRALPGRMSAEVLADAFADLAERGAIRRQGSLLHLPGHQPRLTGWEVALWEKVRPYLEAGDLRPPRVHEVAEKFDVAPDAAAKLLSHATRLGLVYRVADNRYFPPGAVRRLAAIAEALAAEAPDGRFDAKAYRDRSGIGRNVTIEVLEFLDRAGLTRRRGDVREVVAPAASLFGAAGNGATSDTASHG